jgi:hypothetical protein
VSGLVMTLLDIYFSAVPIIQVKNSLLFTLKIVAVIICGNLLGVLLYWVRTRGQATKLPSDTGRESVRLS